VTDAEKKGPHESLTGMELQGGWKVVRRTTKAAGATGGYFSCGYIVEHVDGRFGYLKALDFFSMLPDSPDPARDLEPLIRAFNFERDVLETCRQGKLSRIVTALGSGSVTVPGFPPPATVQYIIFELADGDVRSLMATAAGFDAVLVMRTLHHVATGLRQLHGIGVAHQDLKPSNILRFEAVRSSKLGDLGRAAVRGSEPPHYGAMPAGDYGYAPPEALYGGPIGSWEARRLGCDAYHLGSMICSLVTTVGMTPLMMMSLHPSHRWQSWTGSWEETLVFLRPAFIDAVDYVAAELPRDIRDDVVTVLKQLCEPDPTKRGHPLDGRIAGGNTFSLERYVAKLDLLARRAELAIRARVS
jgi:eukaryotic-like serine/threonine-protein kinase